MYIIFYRYAFEFLKYKMSKRFFSKKSPPRKWHWWLRAACRTKWFASKFSPSGHRYMYCCAFIGFLYKFDPCCWVAQKYVWKFSLNPIRLLLSCAQWYTIFCHVTKKIRLAFLQHFLFCATQSFWLLVKYDDWTSGAHYFLQNEYW